MKKSAPHQQQLFRKLMLAIQQSEVDFSNYRVQFFFFNCISANSYSIQFNYLIIVLTPFRERKRERSTYIQQFYCVLRNTKQHDLSQYCCQQENFQQEKAYYKYCLLNVIRSKFICDNLLRCFLQLCYKQYLGKILLSYFVIQHAFECLEFLQQVLLCYFYDDIVNININMIIHNCWNNYNLWKIFWMAVWLNYLWFAISIQMKEREMQFFENGVEVLGCTFVF
eukprot:TRINITY_DN2659_c1_g1_i4.p1 TRINITY_DN2659_c1_g1~~TRINITY_DN2659_c1_g1_i4.p1  ORF type:complete len:224 (+),score=-8.86 TRINITY_DN2659_c1_g1_i4:813-1484(+)